MDEEYMTDESVEAAPNATTEEPSDEKTALLPISFFQGKELTPGSTCSVKVVSVDDDQVQVSYVAHKEEEEGAQIPTSMGEAEEPDMMA